MRIIRFICEDGEVHHGEPVADHLAIELTGSITKGFARTEQRVKISKLLTPIEPRDIICIGRNYKGQAESGKQKAEIDHNIHDHTLEVFLKPSTSLQHPNDSIFIPQFNGIDPQLDCEGELAIIIGREARHVSERDAINYIFGYTIANDITARHFQTPAGPPLWMRGKGFNAFCPIGPAMVTVDEIADPNNLAIRTMINGHIVRDGNTRDMLRTVWQIIAALSRHMTLPAGAVILTGAPPSASPSTLKPGDIAAVQIEGLGELHNPIESA